MDFLRAHGLVPLSRTNWSLLLKYWQYFPFLTTPIQLLTDWYPMGKTSYLSPLTLPGRPSWMLMELTSPLTLVVSILTNPSPGPMSWNRKYLTALYLLHYAHRAIVSPLRNPSMADMHVVIFLAGVVFNIVNGSAIGGWLAGYGPGGGGRAETSPPPPPPPWMVGVGSVLFFAGLAGNIYHEEILRGMRRMGREEGEEGEKIVSEDGERVYRIPKGGLFRFVWFPHYFVEWIEWTGYTIAGGGVGTFWPATLFVVNEMSTMLPRALAGKRWYEKKFGAKAPDRMAAIPGVI